MSTIQTAPKALPMIPMSVTKDKQASNLSPFQDFLGSHSTSELPKEALEWQARALKRLSESGG